MLRLTRETFGAARQVNAPATDTGNHFALLLLLPSAPLELIEASYRVLARIHHPDRGGRVSDMQRVNAAYAALRERAVS